MTDVRSPARGQAPTHRSGFRKKIKERERDMSTVPKKGKMGARAL